MFSFILLVISNYINVVKLFFRPFLATHFYTPWKRYKIKDFLSDVFRDYRKRPVAWNGSTCYNVNAPLTEQLVMAGIDPTLERFHGIKLAQTVWIWRSFIVFACFLWNMNNVRFLSTYWKSHFFTLSWRSHQRIYYSRKSSFSEQLFLLWLLIIY